MIDLSERPTFSNSKSLTVVSGLASILFKNLIDSGEILFSDKTIFLIGFDSMFLSIFETSKSIC